MRKLAFEKHEKIVSSRFLRELSQCLDSNITKRAKSNRSIIAHFNNINQEKKYNAYVMKYI